MPPALNKNNAAVKRIMREAKELTEDDSTDYSAAPLEDDIFEWHCTLRGPDGTDYEGGLYHFRIKLPAEYPFRPPAIQMLTPNGRFELNSNICISFTNYHEESWQPAWGVRTAIIGLQGFFPLTGKAAVGVGGVEYPTLERKRLAKVSREWVCSTCQKSNLECLPDPSPDGKLASTTVSEIESQTTSIIQRPAAVATPTEQTLAPEQVPLPKSPELTPAPAVSYSSDRARVAGLQTAATTTAGEPRIRRTSQPHLPILLDTAICVLLVLIAALLCRRLL